MGSRKTANIMIIGRTGAGKSELINYLLNEEVAETGCGEPVTQSFDEYYFTFRDGFRIKIYDSKGLEVDSFDQCVLDIQQFVSVRCKSDNPADWLHAVIYCINVAGKRIEPVEINFIKKIHELTQTKMLIVLTHCQRDYISKDESDMLKKIRDELERIATPYRVNSIKEIKITGEVFHTFGRKQILDDLDGIVWDNTSHRMATEYAKDLRSGLLSVVEEIESELCRKIDRQKWSRLTRYILSNEPLESSEKKLNCFEKECDRKFYEGQQILFEMYFSFKGKLKGENVLTPEVAASTVAEKIISLDSLYAVLKKGQYISKVMEKADKLPMGDRIKVKLTFHLTIRAQLKEYVHNYCVKMIDKIPSERRIAKEYEEKLLQTRNEIEKHTPKIYKYDRKSAE